MATLVSFQNNQQDGSRHDKNCGSRVTADREVAPDAIWRLIFLRQTNTSPAMSNRAEGPPTYKAP